MHEYARLCTYECFGPWRPPKSLMLTDVRRVWEPNLFFRGPQLKTHWSVTIEPFFPIFFPTFRIFIGGRSVPSSHDQVQVCSSPMAPDQPGPTWYRRKPWEFKPLKLGRKNSRNWPLQLWFDEHLLAEPRLQVHCQSLGKWSEHGRCENGLCSAFSCVAMRTSCKPSLRVLEVKLVDRGTTHDTRLPDGTIVVKLFSYNAWVHRHVSHFNLWCTPMPVQVLLQYYIYKRICSPTSPNELITWLIFKQLVWFLIPNREFLSKVQGRFGSPATSPGLDAVLVQSWPVV